MMMTLFSLLTVTATLVTTSLPVYCFQQISVGLSRPASVVLAASNNQENSDQSSLPSESSRRDFLVTSVFGTAVATTVGTIGGLTGYPQEAEAIGPVKINLLNPTYNAIPCPKDKPIPGEKAMKGMKGLCVTVDVDLEDAPEKELEKVGVYGFVTDKGTGESVLANNPDLSTDAGQFAMVPVVTPKDKQLQFEFIAAVPKDMDTSQFEEGIAPLTFDSLRVISFPGGQQYGAINPCEMNEFSDECEVWEEENGPYVKGDFMVKSNPRTKGR